MAELESGGPYGASLKVASSRFGSTSSIPAVQKPHLTPGGSRVLADPARIDEEFRKAWLPYFCRSGQRDTSLEEFNLGS